MLQAYTVNRFMVCEVSGITRIEESLQITDIPKVNIIEFSNRDKATNYVRQHQRDWFFTVLENWINHKFNIYKSVNDSAKFALVHQMRDVINNDLQNKKLSTAANRILAKKETFLSLVPGTQNPSHESSLQGINEIFEFCEIAKTYDY